MVSDTKGDPNYILDIIRDYWNDTGDDLDEMYVEAIIRCGDAEEFVSRSPYVTVEEAAAVLDWYNKREARNE